MQQTKAQLNKMLAACQAKRAELEKDPIIVAWKKFLALPYDKQVEIRAKWDEYYAQVHESPIYLLVESQKEAAFTGQVAVVKDLADQAKRMREDGANITLDYPSSVDVFEFDCGATVKAYRFLQKKIKELVNASDVEIQNGVVNIFS